MKTYYVDAAAGERHLLVRMASSAIATLREAVQQALDPDTLLVLRNQAAIMQALEDIAKPHAKDDLRKQRKLTEERLAQPPPLEAAA